MVEYTYPRTFNPPLNLTRILVCYLIVNLILEYKYSKKINLDIFPHSNSIQILNMKKKFNLRVNSTKIRYTKPV